jgi:hypothetical protein
MKRILKMAAFVIILAIGSSLHNKASAQYYDEYDDRDREVNYQTFYDELSPHGRWVEYPGHGFVWVPEVEDDFQPYSTNGRWVYTDDYEWMWVSDYDWGWAPFHYGRWDHDDDYGWYWVPDYEWAPAWVAWRDGGDYYGWAPIRPGFSININVNIGGYRPPDYYWCFIPRVHIMSPRWYDYRIDRGRNVTIINYTTIINYNTYRSGFGFRCGPRRYDAERYCGRINPVRIRDSYRPGRSFFRNNEVNCYRPNVRVDRDRQFSPREFHRYERGSGGFRRDRSDNGFRREDMRRNDGDIRRNDDRQRDDRFRRDNNEGQRNRDDRFRRNDGDNNNGFERPGRDRRDMNNDNRGFRRDDDREPRNVDNNNRGPDRRQFERRDNDREPRPERNMRNNEPRPERNPNREVNDRRFERRTFEPGNNGNRPPDRQPEVRRNNWPDRQPAQQPERREVRRNDAPERRVEPARQERPQQFERRESGGGNGGGNRFERRDDGGGRQREMRSDNGGGNGGGRGRRF